MIPQPLTTINLVLFTHHSFISTQTKMAFSDGEGHFYGIPILNYALTVSFTFNAALTKPTNNGCGAATVLLYSG